MANVQPETEQESDDDCEVYFLKPANEYNIVDKIKEANKELFGYEMGNEFELMPESQQNRKVSFAANLEEYEQETGINLKELEIRLGRNCVEDNEIYFLKTDREHLQVIAEEDLVNEIDSNESRETSPEETEHEQEEEKQPVRSCESSEDVEHRDELDPIQFTTRLLKEDNKMLEDICEEILIMDMESEKPEVSVEAKCDSSGTGMQRKTKVLKQIVFNFTEEDNKIDNKSLTNPLISDNENDEIENQEYNCNESLNDDTDSESKDLSADTKYYNYEEEDDKLSIIVASYLPDDVARDKTFLTTFNLKRSPLSSKTRKLPFNKRFSLRRKTKYSNAIGSCTTQQVSNNGRFMPPPEVTDLKLHCKTCCEFKNAHQNLPKYPGYLSEYGLSREQLMERERKLQQKQKNKFAETLKASEVEMRKMHDNERAFTAWLKNKMNFPINKTRNMFDVKRPFGLRKCTSLVRNVLSDDARQMLNPSKYV